MTLSIDLSDEEREKILLGDPGRDLIMEKVFNQILQAEMSDHLGVDRYERSEDRTGYRNGSYERGGRVRLSDHSRGAAHP